MPQVSQLGEFGLIDLIKKQCGKMPAGVEGIGDDAAVVPWTRTKRLLITTDMLVEGVHFVESTPPQAVGYKALACSLSDIAAMGGIPKHAVVSLGVPPALSCRVVRKMYAGMQKAAQPFGVRIVGGDTVRSHKIVINIALTGEVLKKNLVTRSGAKQGDLIFVTGPLGGSLKSGRHLRFIPRVKESQYLVRNFKINAMIDISDGLAADLVHIVEASGVGAVLKGQRIPKAKGATLRQALYDGEDFELLFTVAPAAARRLFAQNKVKVYCLGEVVRDTLQVYLETESGRRVKLPANGFTHF